MKKMMMALLGLSLMVSGIFAGPDLNDNEMKLLMGLELSNIKHFLEVADIQGRMWQPYKFKDQMSNIVFSSKRNKGTNNMDAYKNASLDARTFISGYLNNKKCLKNWGTADSDKYCPLTSLPAQKVNKAFTNYVKKSEQLKTKADGILQDYEKCELGQSWWQKLKRPFTGSSCDTQRSKSFEDLKKEFAKDQSNPKKK